MTATTITGSAAAGAPRGSALDRRYAMLGLVLIAPSVMIFCMVIVYPLVSAIYLSLFSIYTPTLQGDFVGLDNYATLMASGEFWRSLLNTVIWTVCTLTLQIVFGIAVALVLHQNMAFRALARSLILFPYFVSTVVAVLVWRWLFNDLYGILNHMMMWAGLVDMPLDYLGSMPNAMISVVIVGAWKYFPFVVIAVLARLQTIPEPLYEAAKIDGAGPIARFFDVTLPQLRDVLVVIILLRAIWDFKEFDLIFLLTGGGPLISTQTLPLMVYKDAFGLNDMGRASAVAVTMMLVMLVFMIAYLRLTGREEKEAAQ
ncbi:carbohydrate ABC transporter permease [Salinarimonas ramus]|uniref:Sugar ABC transporter permease n=1 Tax=Salinarimonas ramus TaxID=690164 RepID=A0A917QHC7_9HYPH|nr:sugar ABC transporter permease [Salinarimonas ramus]GGK50791.1 sugar ABC transporter permease [Salinarimonas ramus]